jgi:hypothetical protein
MPVKPLGEDGKEHPRINDREVLDGILWVLRTEAAWQELEETVRKWVAHPSGKTGCAEGLSKMCSWSCDASSMTGREVLNGWVAPRSLLAPRAVPGSAGSQVDRGSE